MEVLAELQRRLNLPETGADPADFDPPPVQDSDVGHENTPENRTVMTPSGKPLPPFFPVVPQCLCDTPAAFDPTSDETLCRFLRARQMKVDDAETMYKECIRFRAKWQVDKILDEEDPLEDMWQSETPIAHCNYDKRGRPVIIERTGEARSARLMAHLTKHDLYYRHVRHMEMVMRRISLAQQHFGPHVSQCIIVMDLKNMPYTMNSHDLPLFRQTLGIDSSFYPERLAAFFIINAPWIFKPIWAIVRLWLAPRTKSKFHVLGSDYASTLLKYIDADQLPVEYGGTSPDVVPPAGPMPKEYVWPTKKTRCQTAGLSDEDDDGTEPSAPSPTAKHESL